jgi:hypothetical protein
MAANNSKGRSALGGNPLSKGIFSKTEDVEPQPAEPTEIPAPLVEIQESIVEIQESIVNTQESTIETLEPLINIQESIVNIQESRFLNKGERESVNLRLPIELNDWLNDLLKKGKRKHGSKIPKEVWVQAALELFRSMPLDWEEIDTEENLHSVLFNLESRLNNLD